MHRIKKASNILLSLLIISAVFLNSISVYAADVSKTNLEMNQGIDYSSCKFESYIDEKGNTIIHANDVRAGVDDSVILERDTHNIIYKDQIVGHFSTTLLNVEKAGLNASSTWNYLGVTNYTITATGAGITAAVIAILAGFLGGGAAAALVGGLSAFVGTATAGGTLTVYTWDRFIGSQYYQKYKIKFTTSTGEVWGPVETIKTF